MDTPTPGRIFLKKGKEKPLRNHHPWIFSGAIAHVEDAQDGETVEVFDAGGGWLARAAYNSRSQITARVWTFRRDEPVDRALFERRIESAAAWRRTLFPDSSSQPTAYRLVNAESDGLPGIVIDRYADWLVVQILTLGASRQAETLVDVLQEQFTPRGIYSRSDVDVRRKEGLAETRGVLRGDEPPDRIEIVENGLDFLVDVKQGQKTGFYLDQRANRERAAPYLKGRVLNAFAYTGAFGVYAARLASAQVTNLDSSAPALELARLNFERNGLQAEYVIGDVFQVLREYRGQERRFDAIVLDPPKFVTSAGNLERGARGYKDLNLLAFQLLDPNGFLVTFSCSGLVSADLFQKIVFGAAHDANADAQVLSKLGHSPDHPVSLNFPEGEYLKGLILRV